MNSLDWRACIRLNVVMMDGRPGQMLIASRRLGDPNFQHAVVLIVQRDESGVMGLILNRPVKATVADACASTIAAAAGVDLPLHQGGPCPGPIMVLHNDQLAGGDQILQGVRFAVQRDQIEPLMREAHGPVKYFAGYSGWGVEQLESELAEGAWLVADATADAVFSDETDAQWAEFMTRLTLGKWIDPEKLPDDPSVN